MARIFPESLPREIRDDARRSSEVMIYNALREQLDERYCVFYSSPWLGTNPDGSEVDGEADFLVAHPQKGLLTIEVKGGRVEIDRDDNWSSTDRHGIPRHIKNPVEQARKSKYHILEKLKESPLWKPRYICARHGVILPHSTRPARDFRPDMPLKLFAFNSDINHLDAWVASRLDGTLDENDKTEALGNDGVAALSDMLTRPIHLHVPLGSYLRDDLQTINLRTNDQIFILKEMEENQRMAIAGAAGTGKTILAIEKTVMLAEAGKRVLLLCFNRPLGNYLQEKMDGYHGVTARHFHRYCRDVAIGAGLNPEEFSVSELAEDLVDNFCDAGLEEYDAVIVDEGQDFTDDWLASLEVVVRNGEDGVLYIFYDDNQRVMHTSTSYIKSLPLAKHRLTRNFRNTRAIFNTAENFYQGSPVRAIGPDGEKPAFHVISGDSDLKPRLAERVGELVNAEDISPGDIAILFSDRQELEAFRDSRGVRIGRYRASDAEHRNDDNICVDTIRRFKGLESPVIFLVASTDISSSYELLYVGITRAQALLEVFGQKHVINRILSENR
ncbi:NERD domain-containing protein [Microbulbifer sp. SA54]|uniref:nuclease-related domain-containing DEAD/DEAH box helicase n=1 Tax=Microbulbifer sp. SA54 TaxID=3401577 RepID=UPI003AAB9C4B